MSLFNSFIHSECTPVHLFRILLTPEGKYVFDTYYQKTLVLTDGNVYESVDKCVESAISFIDSLASHKVQSAVVC